MRNQQKRWMGLLLAAALLLSACGKRGEDAPVDGPPPDPPPAGQPEAGPAELPPALAAKFEALSLLDARLGNPYSTEDKGPLLEEAAQRFDEILGAPQTFALGGGQLMAPGGHLACVTGEALAFGGGQVRLVEYGRDGPEPEDRLFYTLQYAAGTPGAERIVTMDNAGPYSARSIGSRLLADGEALYFLAFNLVEAPDGPAALPIALVRGEAGFEAAADFEPLPLAEGYALSEVEDGLALALGGADGGETCRLTVEGGQVLLK
ncbi:MAG: hypothetical protein GXX99_02475 [Clostridiales bacterium]|nr:hypothetical protein [Clostridiales bacterium]